MAGGVDDGMAVRWAGRGMQVWWHFTLPRASDLVTTAVTGHWPSRVREGLAPSGTIFCVFLGIVLANIKRGIGNETKSSIISNVKGFMSHGVPEDVLVSNGWTD